MKRLHAGYAARNGVLAAQMSAAGISAPLRSLDGKYGFLALYGHEPVLSALTTMGARGLAIHDISIKPYACCRLLLMIDGLRTTTAAQAPSGESAFVPRTGQHNMVTRPRASMAAVQPAVHGWRDAGPGPERFDAV